MARAPAPAATVAICACVSGPDGRRGTRSRDDRVVRITPLIGRKAWFAPRRLGWGLDPASPEGWAVVLLALAAGSAARWGKAPRWLGPASVAALVAIALVKGTSPGGPRARAEWRAATGRASQPA